MNIRFTAFLSLLAALLLACHGQPLEALIVIMGAGAALQATPLLGAAVVYGTAHLWGVSGTVSNATVMAFKLDDECGINESTYDEAGIRIEGRYDDNHKTGTITLRIRSGFTIPAAGSFITYETVVYELTKVGRTQAQKGFRDVEFSILKTSAVTAS